MKNHKFTFALSLIAITIAISALVMSWRRTIDVTASVTQQQQQNTITVTGEAQKAVVPDTASVSLTVAQTSPRLSDATQSVNQRVEGVVQALKRIGIDQKNITTKNYTVQPEYDWNDGKQHFRGYHVSQELAVEVHDIPKISEVLAQIDAFRIDHVSQLRFYTDDEKTVRDALRKEAIDDAKQKARKLARDLGVKLGDLTAFHEGRDGAGVPVPQGDFMRVEKSVASVQPTIPVGENDHHIFVTLTYKIQ